MGGSAEVGNGGGGERAVPQVPVQAARPFLDTFRGNLKETFFPDDPFRGVAREKGAGRRAVAALRYFFPFMEWLPAYTLGTLKSDLIAGITIASLAIPQGISYAKLANLPPILGLYSSFVPPLVYAMMGSSKDLAVGTVAVASLLIGSMLGAEVPAAENPALYLHLAFTATFFAGVFQASLGLLRLGFIVDFLSHATIVGFMGGAATVVCLQQLKGLLGLDHFTTSTDLVSVVRSVFSQTHQWRWESVLLGCGFLFFLLLTRFISKRQPKLFWISAAAPLTSVILGSLLVYLTHAENHGIQVIGYLKKGLNPPSVTSLNFSSPYMMLALKTGIITGVIALAEGIAVGRSFAMFKNYHIDGNKEMIAFGTMNIIGSFTSCYLTTGPFSRSAQSSSSKDVFLSSGFLFSLPTQRPNPEANCKGMISLRSAACKIQGPQRLQAPWIEKAWCSLCNTQVACKSYLRPGLSARVKDCDRDHAHIYGTSSSCNVNKMDNVPRNRIPSQESMHQSTESGTLENNSSHQPAGINSCTRAYKSSHVVQADTIRTTNQCNFTRNGAELCQTAPVADNMCTDDKLDAMDDDEILAAIDVDRIVTEHYQATNTSRGLASWQMSTPSGNRCNLNSLDENSLPQELSDICKHGFKLAFCPEAKNHLQEMKDQLIAVCNELIDGSGELSPQHSKELRQKRVHLKKQIQLLEEYMVRSTYDDERQRSHSMASTPAIQDHYPPMTPRNTFVMDTARFQSSVYIRNEPGNSGLCYSPAPYSYMDSLNTPLTSIQRDYTPRIIDISYTEGSGDTKWSCTDFPWTKELEANNKRVFGNRSFRPNQREIINATMSGNDVFVLMPTGGGKSLTYQLPALIDEGITLVVSPLVSLIQDQIMHLLQANIPAAYLSASMEWSEQQEILRGLMSCTCTYKLLYVTPEKIAKSDALLRQLENVYSRGHLSRIVIDEAHCVSQWGHDFRPDYQHLGILKRKFPHTPVLALTATATASVKEDVVQVLGLANCIVFRQSFNRPNLRYYVRPKTKKCLEDIDSFIRANHPKECGIIYCLSRMDCEKVAEKLRERGHKASHYHGSMDPNDRAHIQRQWSMDKINIICATVAFGMGINKPDVRFVIHHSLPKSIEGYHQECGRAGRDGQLSSCVLYYNYSDYIRVKHMLTQGVVEQIASAPRGGSSSSHEQALETHKENLLRMVSYCENDVDCRRLLQLIHFGEMFDPSHCAKTCDNCLKELTWIEKDVTMISRQLVELVMMTRQTCSISHILEVYRGSVSQNVKKHRHDTLSLHGAGKHLAKGEAARIIRHLVTEEILIEDVKKSDNMYGSVSSVLKANPTKVGDLRVGKHSIVLKFPTPEKAPRMGKLDESSVPQINKTVQQQSKVDENLASILYETLRCLRRQILEENEGYSAHHIFINETLREISNRMPRTKEELLEINGIGKVKLSKYGDRVLATIEDFLNKYPNASKKSNSSGSNEHTEAVKKRRGFTATNTSSNGDDFEERTVQSKKRAAKTRNTKVISDAASMVHDARCVDPDLDGYEAVEDELCSVQKPVASGRVLPKWPSTGTNGNAPVSNLFEEFRYTG